MEQEQDSRGVCMEREWDSRAVHMEREWDNRGVCTGKQKHVDRGDVHTIEEEQEE